jgi:hypothetical protein
MSIIRSMYNTSPSGEELPIYEVKEMDRRGEAISISMDQTDENGDRISHVLVEWYGMSNEEANAFSMTVAGAVVGVADKFRQEKAAQGGGPVISPSGLNR